MSFTALLLNPDEEREAHRKTSRTRATLAMPGHGSQPVIVHNISEGGVLIEAHRKLESGQDVILDIPLVGTHAARVMWDSGDLHGCRFKQPIPSSLIQRKLAGEKVVWDRFGPRRIAQADDDDDAPRARPAMTSPVPRFSPEILAASVPAAQPDPGGLPIGARVAIIFGLALSCWAVPAGLLYLLG